MSCNDMIYDIREALGISLYGTAATIRNEATRRLVGSLEMLEADQLSALHAVSVKASSMRDDAAREYHESHDDEERCKDLCRGEGVLQLRHWITRNDLEDVYILAKAVDRIPEGMRFLKACDVIAGVRLERFPLDTPDLITAHLEAAHGTSKLRMGYRPDMMILVQMHPDKVKTILALTEKHGNTPSHRKVLDHHGVEPALFDGVL